MRERVGSKDVITGINTNSKVKTVRTQKPSSLEDSVTTYCLIGQNDTEDIEGFPVCSDIESKLVCAKKVVRNGIVKHFIKMNHVGELINPLDRTFTSYSKKMRGGHLVWDYKQVTFQKFKSYLMFLKTQKPAHFNVARRS